MGYENWPAALEATIRYANWRAQIPVIVTENGIATEVSEKASILKLSELNQRRPTVNGLLFSDRGSRGPRRGDFDGIAGTRCRRRAVPSSAISAVR
jgi:hypothetical protein